MRILGHHVALCEANALAGVRSRYTREVRAVGVEIHLRALGSGEWSRELRESGDETRWWVATASALITLTEPNHKT
jgi:hypothetical protein